MNNNNTQVQVTAVTHVKKLLEEENVKKRFQDVLGNKAPSFMATIVNVVSGNDKLKKCDASSIMSAAFIAASFDLPIDSNLGFSAIVPYECNKRDANGNWYKMNVAQFQIMYKGFIQLAIRSGVYEKMNCSEVYEDELVSYNPITGECEFIEDFKGASQRMNGDTDKIVGYYAWFRLKTGFVKELFMSKAEVVNHAKKYSSSYKYDLNNNKNSSNWSTDFSGMAKKTVIKLLLSKWGMLSVDMQRAIQEDQKTYEIEEGSYGDNKIEQKDAAEDPFINGQVEKQTETTDKETEVVELDITQ